MIKGDIPTFSCLCSRSTTICLRYVFLGESSTNIGVVTNEYQHLVSSINTSTFTLHLLNRLHCRPSTTDDLVLARLSEADLFRYARTCRSAYRVVQSYIKRAYQLHKVLEKYFSPEQTLEFRALQAQTGMLISGSTALQFLDRTTFPESDLDVYVEHQLRCKIALWLVTIGYKYKPTPKYPRPERELFAERDLPQFLSTPLERYPTAFNPSADQLSGSNYGPFRTYNFVKSHPERKIQLVTTQGAPLRAVLAFHSSTYV